MDRREALKKMAVGGVTIVGASSVLSSTAFADGGTPDCQPTGLPTFLSGTTGAPGGSSPISFTVGPATTTSIQLTAAGMVSSMASCPCTSTPGDPVLQYRWSLVRTRSGDERISANPDGTAVISDGFQLSYVPAAYIVRPGAASLLDGRYGVQFTVRWVCTDGSKARYRCLHWIVDLNKAGTAASFRQPVANGGGDSSGCDNPEP